MKVFDLEIITPVKKAFQGKVKAITVPGTLGSFQVLYNHAPLISTLEVGKIKIIDENDKETYYATSGGMIEVLNNKVLVLADTFETPEEIILERAMNSLNRAKERLKARKSIDIARAEAALARAINRISIHKSYQVTIQ